MLSFRLLCASLLAFLTGCVPADPTAPRYSYQYQLIEGRKPDSPVEVARDYCALQSDYAGQNAETAYENSRGGASSAGGNAFSSIAFGMAKADAGSRAERATMAMCMANFGYVRQRVCVANC